MPVDDPAVDARWDRAARHQTETERLDRNWSSLLQELRVVQTGVQLLTGLLLTLPFQPRFDVLDDGMRVVYLITVGCSVACTVAVGGAGRNASTAPPQASTRHAGVRGTPLRLRRTAAVGAGARRSQHDRLLRGGRTCGRCHCGRRGIGGVRGVLACGAIADASGPTADYAVTEQYSGCAHVRCGARPICVRPR